MTADDTRALADDRGTEQSGRGGRPAGDTVMTYSAGICKVFPVTLNGYVVFLFLV